MKSLLEFLKLLFGFGVIEKSTVKIPEPPKKEAAVKNTPPLIEIPLPNLIEETPPEVTPEPEVLIEEPIIEVIEVIEVIEPKKELPRFSANVVNRINQIINVFENGKKEIDYSSIYIYNDGPNSMKQLTLGRGFTEFGNLAEVVKAYVAKHGEFANGFSKYLNRIGKSPSLYNDQNLKDLFKISGSDPIMQLSQDLVFESKYWNPALKFFTDNGFTKPLSMLVIFDSYLHSGSILSFLRSRFSEMPPAKGGREEVWISQYVESRQNWLANHSSRILQNTVYRTETFKAQILNDNWDLTEPVNANGIIV